MRFPPARIIFLCTSSISSTSAFSWGKSRARVLDPEARGAAIGYGMVLNDLASSGLKPDEVETLFLQNDALDEYPRKPDCFRRAAGLVRGRCGEADMDEGERVKAAISLTLCEVSTARHYSVPMECLPFGSESQPASESSPEDCVEALSRSAQFWSSYSGYLREVPQLCYAFRRWNDIDTAKDIYRNATLEKLALIRLLVTREKLLVQSQEQWEALRTDMSVLLGNLHESAIGFDEASQVVLRTMADVFQHGSMTLQASLSDVEHRIQAGTAQYLLQMETVVGALTDKHALSLSSIAQSLERALSSALDKSFLALNERTEGIVVLSRDMSNLWENMIYDFGSMQQVRKLAFYSFAVT
ncbi:hypothetical protein NEOLEDRAFT_626652 [Neolentinus lepideus HHB14362 ss-1]|uniref:Uncharacterized protein n=1 Tax=Neolentinus lepideus HHB14362 ss-1 TaxID=1314782 RepID=A0A165QQ87_9AGAM|nr:hypothetical protein NEOLEDRAFT_626652 [Neolentinus lepideus HHB14362 ss-1]